MTLQDQIGQDVFLRLREPINDLVDRYCVNKTAYQKLRLRQLAWQAVDVLVRTNNLAGLNSEPDIKRITRDIRSLGASAEFIEESLHLAGEIYKQMQVLCPAVLKNYGRS